LAKVRASLSSPAVAHLHPTAALAERALLPDDPGQALALTRVLFDETPRMFNHHRGLWGYSGTAIDGAPLTVQSTGVGGPSAAIVVAELHALGLRRAVRIGRAWALDGSLRAGELVAATSVVATDGASRALGAPATVEPDAALAGALRADRSGALASADVPEGDPTWGALAFDLESAAVLAAAARAGIPAACLVAIEGPIEPEDVAERLGRAALRALAPVSGP
jgi:uridine phosphorylase